MKELDFLEGLPASAGSALYRGKKKKKKKITPTVVDESYRPVRESRTDVVALEQASEAMDDQMTKPGIVKAILISEGLGNRADMNYYSRQAIESGPPIFEGEVMMMNHMGIEDEKNRPEGDVEKTVGYYKNVRSEMVEGLLSLTADLHFDLSESGQQAYKKALSCLQYKKDFPNSQKEYLGVSINAGGESEPRTIAIDGQMEEVNYVTQFTVARSADMVTKAGARGRIRGLVTLMEDVFGARMKTKEVRMETVKRLQALQKALKEAQSEKDSGLREKKISEAQTGIDSLLKDIEVAAEKKLEAKREAIKAREDAGDMPDDHQTGDENCECGSCKEEGGEEEPGDKGEPSSTTITHTVKHKGKAAIAAASASQAEAAREAKQHRLSVKQLVSESGLKENKFDMEELYAMSFEEAEREIARTKRICSAVAREAIESVGAVVQASSGVRLTESGRAERSNDDAFVNIG